MQRPNKSAHAVARHADPVGQLGTAHANRLASARVVQAKAECVCAEGEPCSIQATAPEMLGEVELNDLELCGFLIDHEVVEVRVLDRGPLPLQSRYSPDAHIPQCFRLKSVLAVEKQLDALGREYVAGADDGEVQLLSSGIQCEQQDCTALDQDELILVVWQVASERSAPAKSVGLANSGVGHKYLGRD